MRIRSVNCDPARIVTRIHTRTHTRIHTRTLIRTLTRTLTLTRHACVVAAAVVCAAPACAQQVPAFDPFAGENRDAYRADLDKNFFTSDGAAREHAELTADLAGLERAAHDRTVHLTALLVKQDSVMRRLNRYVAYLSLKTLLNTNDSASLQRMGQIQAAANDPFNAVSEAMSRASEDEQVEAKRRGYGFSLDRARGAARPTVSDSAAATATALANEAAAWGPALFRATLATMPYEPVQTPEGVMDPRKQAGGLRSHPDRDIRERAYLSNQGAIESRRDTFANILMKTAATLNRSARLLAYEDYVEQSYGQRYLTRAAVTNLLNALADSSGAAKEYERLREARVKRQFGYDTVHIWDLAAPERQTGAPRLTVGAARQAIRSAVAPLGDNYLREMSRLLDPSNGRLDMIPRAGRVERPGFSTGSVGYPSVFYQGRYDGFAGDVIIFAHEAGHAVQNMLMDRAGVLSRYANGPSYFTESFALFNEMLVLDHLARTSATEEDRMYFRQTLLDQTADLYRNAWESLLEQQVFDSVRAGRTLDADQMEAMTQNTASRFSIWMGPGSEREYMWVQPLQLYTWPLYRINYVYAKLLALTYFDMITRDRTDFVRRYNILLSSGYDAPPDALLQRSLGIRIDADALVARASALMRRWTADLRQDYGMQ